MHYWDVFFTPNSRRAASPLKESAKCQEPTFDVIEARPVPVASSTKFVVGFICSGVSAEKA